MTNKNSFAVVLPSAAQDSNGFYKAGLIDKVINKYPWLTVAGVDDPYKLKSGRELRGVQYAGANNIITFGTAKSHDVNWIERPDYAREKGYQPVYNLIKDWNTVTAKLDTFAMAKKPVPTYNTYAVQNSGSVFYAGGQKVEVFDNFFKIGYNIIPRNAETTKYVYGGCCETKKIVTITIKNLY